MQTLAKRRAREERFALATGNPVRFQRARRGGTGQAVTWRRQSGSSKPEPTKEAKRVSPYWFLVLLEQEWQAIWLSKQSNNLRVIHWKQGLCAPFFIFLHSKT